MPCKLRDCVSIRMMVLGRGVDLWELLKGRYRLLQAAEVDLGIGVQSILKGEKASDIMKVLESSASSTEYP